MVPSKKHLGYCGSKHITFWGQYGSKQIIGLKAQRVKIKNKTRNQVNDSE